MSEDQVIVNALVRQFMVAIEEVMGKNGLDAVLRSAGLDKYVDNLPPDNLEAGVMSVEYARLNEEIEKFYGRGGPGFLKRIGRASFQYGLREQSALMGLAGLALKVLPEKQRIKVVLSNMMDALKKSNPQVDGWVTDEGGAIAYIERTCASCVGRASEKPVCYMYLGAVTEAVQWATGKQYHIVETHCRALGHEYCRFEVGEPLD